MLTCFLYFFPSLANSCFSCTRKGRAHAVSGACVGAPEPRALPAHPALPLDERVVQRPELLGRPVGVKLLQAGAVLGVGAGEVGHLDDAHVLEPGTQSGRRQKRMARGGGGPAPRGSLGEDIEDRRQGRRQREQQEKDDRHHLEGTAESWR